MSQSFIFFIGVSPCTMEIVHVQSNRHTKIKVLKCTTPLTRPTPPTKSHSAAKYGATGAPLCRFALCDSHGSDARVERDC